LPIRIVLLSQALSWLEHGSDDGLKQGISMPKPYSVCFMQLYQKREQSFQSQA